MVGKCSNYFFLGVSTIIKFDALIMKDDFDMRAIDDKHMIN